MPQGAENFPITRKTSSSILLPCQVKLGPLRHTSNPSLPSPSSSPVRNSRPTQQKHKRRGCDPVQPSPTIAKQSEFPRPSHTHTPDQTLRLGWLGHWTVRHGHGAWDEMTLSFLRTFEIRTFSRDAFSCGSW